MKNTFQAPALGSHVEIVIDTSDSHRKLAPCSRHRVSPHTLIRGKVIPTPKYFPNYFSVINSENGVENHIPVYRILSVNNQVVEPPEVTADVVVNVKASKGDGVYTVRQHGVTKQWSCDCMGFNWKKTCKHVTQVKAQHEAG